MNNRLILVAGSGRSGTSLFSGMLKALGCHIPQPEVIADETNPQGFGESQWVVDLHVKLLKAVGVTTSDARPAAWAKTAEIGRDRDVEKDLEKWLRREFRHSDHVVVKDPRLLWFITLWRDIGEIVAAPCFVTCLRHPLEVLKSKQTYYGETKNPNSRVGGWINTMLYTERSTRGSRRSLVRYEDLLSDPMKALAQVSDPLDLAIMERATPNQMRQANKIVNPSLRRSRATWESLQVDGRLIEMAEDLWKVLDSATTSQSIDSPSVQEELDRLRHGYVELYGFADSLAQSSVLAALKEARGKARGLVTDQSLRSPRRALKRMKRKIRRKGREVSYRRRSQKQQPEESASEPAEESSALEASSEAATEPHPRES